jgi:hypothetical protein
MKATYESATADCNLHSTLAQSDEESINPTVNIIGQCFSTAFADELQLRGLVAGRTVMRTLGNTEILQDNRCRTRVEFDIVTAIPGTTHNELIDILVSAKRKCSAKIGSGVKIFLKAELRSGGFEFGLLQKSRLSY